jgi:hypothetical protein
MQKQNERINRHFGLVADPRDLADQRAILDCFDHEIGHICVRNTKTERRQVPLSHPIFPCVGIGRQFGRTRQCPFEPAVFEYFLHRGCVRNDAREEQSAKEIRRRDNCIFKEERDGLDDDTSNSSAWHGARQRDGELP